ncbi:DMT family transporter [Bacillus badius]|uniref:Permease of the drug/metabolite transporter (DMT) superfamily n=1 Tax=Bacillus badius TaxID=1455 RepID=A0ABR5AU15_BACBA|nr:EamA family transporter [Bacillus badius]KIL75702.1 Permease of the drug/metabolite transporter (DMT) superfamily [Bacillus badius]KIL77836.1 Permease of the drug/metabolite transporter (DMT) superfamily [Bacillus badius]KZR59194.1 transporter [Bacillus badius]MED4715663.1 EamA family transporter [Bacillus badius]
MEKDLAYPSRTKGIIMVLASSLFWGASGVIAQFLFQKQGVGVEWLVTARLLAAGLLLLLFAAVKEKQSIFDMWKDRFSWPSLVLFSLFGMLGVQYTFFSAINSGNAATATVLQYLAPVLIVLYLAIRSKARPAGKEIIAVLLSVLGTFFLVTGGNPNELTISGTALFWGLSSAVALAFYTLYPLKLLKRWGSILVVGWAMTAAGVFFSFVHPPWKFEGTMSFATVAAVSFVILFGTLLAFYFYLESLHYLRASETSLLACAEPLSAVFLSVFLLGVPFGFGEWLGTVCIIVTVLMLSRAK